MAGTPGYHQEGDCFLSYDSRATIGQPLVNITQLDYYEKADRTPVLDRAFEKAAGCFLRDSDDGGRYVSAFSAETCAQLCLDDMCCQSFSAGFGVNNGHCFLSYETRATAGSDFVCDPVHQLHYYEKIHTLDFVLNRPLDPLGSATNRSQFEAVLLDRLHELQVQVTTVTILERLGVADLRVQLRLPTSVDGTNLEASVLADRLAFRWPAFIGAQFVARFTPQHGPCSAGAVSQTGHQPGCFTCPKDMYSSGARTICEPCPAGTFSPPGTASVTACLPLDDGGTVDPADAVSEGAAAALPEGSDWVGVFRNLSLPGAAAALSGALEMVVSEVEPHRARLLLSVHHGRFCDPAKDCRVDGLSQYYLEATVSDGIEVDAEFVPGFYGWAGITDRSFPRQSLSGRIVVTEHTVELHGSFGSGTFSLTRQCEPSTELRELRAGDRWHGRLVCDPLLSDDQDKALEGVVDVLGVEAAVEDVDLSGEVTMLFDLAYPSEQALRYFIFPLRNVWRARI